MSRWKAAGIHLSISVLIGLVVVALLFLVWYPGPYFRAAGGEHLLLVLLGVDLVLGPLLTLILFKSGKNGMLLDLCIIAALQLGALIYGLIIIAESRPVFIVAAVDRFSVVKANDITPEDLAQGSSPAFRSLPWTGPRIVAARLPSGAADRNAVLNMELSGRSIEHQPRYYVEYAEEAANLVKHAHSLDGLRTSSPTAAQLIDAWLAENGRTVDDTRWVPVDARQASMSMLLDARSGAVIDVIELDPW